MASLSILKNQGLKALLHRIESKSRHGHKVKHSRNTIQLDALNSTEYYELTPEFSEAILKRVAAEPPVKPDIIIFPFIDWEFRIQRPQHLAIQLAESGHRVFYVQASFSMDKYPLIKRVFPNVYLIKLTQGESKVLFTSSLSKDNVRWLRTALLNVSAVFNIHAAILKVDMPIWQQLVLQLCEEFGWTLVYDCMDDHAGFSPNSPITVQDEQVLLRGSNLVIFSSHVLLNKFEGQVKNSVLIPNATEYEPFHQAAQVINLDLQQKYKNPVIGYYGAIANWFNTQLVAELASAHPEWTFVLVGSTQLANLKPLHGLPNIPLLGEKTYDELPEYLSIFDVCIIPFIQNSLTDATNPVKLYEFLSAGKPIVATRLKEISHYAEYIRFGSTLEDWESAIQAGLTEEKTDELLTPRYKFGRTNTWKSRAEALETELCKLFPKISIIMVTYNKLEYTRQCLESIL